MSRPVDVLAVLRDPHYDLRPANDLAACAEAATALVEAAQGVLDDDAATTSLADQQARWDERMDALRAALATFGGAA